MKPVKRIGLTQRVERVAGHGERRDCLDQRWARLLATRGLVPVPLCNMAGDPRRYVEALGLDGVILTGGNDVASLDGAENTAPERDRFERELLALCSERGWPVLGVCRGAQMLCLFHGGVLRRVADHVARRHAVTRVASQPSSPVGRVVHHWPTRFEVNSYHCFTTLPGRLGSPYIAIAQADDGSAEAMGHRELPQLGILWHPERDSPFVEGPLDIIKSFFVEDRPW
jgi:gamma-glutamyl-gamma-aminobutyrate hydrolase PuuD